MSPYGTLLIPDDVPEVSFSQMLHEVRIGEDSPFDLILFPGFGWRLAIYLWHYYTLIIGSLGIIFAVRSSGWKIFPLIGWIAYNSLLLSFLAVEPRYLFPVMFAFTIFAAYGSVHLWDMAQFSLHKAERVSGPTANAHPAHQ